MKPLLKLKPQSWLVLFSLAFLISCTEKAPENQFRQKQSGDISYGGIVNLNFIHPIQGLFPLNSVYSNSVKIMGQVYEGLVYLDPETNTVEPALAESWEVEADGKSYTFHLRRGVKFHDSPIFPEGKGREFTARDVQFCLEKLCEPAPNNQMSSFMTDIIKGGEAFYNSGGKRDNPKNELEGVQVIDDYTIRIELNYPLVSFLKRLTHSCCYIFPRELYSVEDRMDFTCVGTGPFAVAKMDVGTVVVLEHNKNYWKKDSLGNNLPYLDGIRFTFVDQRRQLEEFAKGNIDFISDLSWEGIDFLAEALKSAEFEYEKGYKPLTQVQYYSFQTQEGLFTDKRLRMAFNMAVDKQQLVNESLGGNVMPAKYGIVPPVLNEYDATSVKAISYNPEEARRLMAEAGFPNGENFPVLTMQMNDDGPRVYRIAENLQKMLTKNLNITIEMSILPRQKHFEIVELGIVPFWRDNWVADYPDPENFLQLFYDGGEVAPTGEETNYMNTARFQNATFDSLMRASKLEQDPQRRMKILAKADQLIMDEAVILPLYYETSSWYSQAKYRNLHMRNDGVVFLAEAYVVQ